MSGLLLFFKSLHIIGVIAWMAGLLYLYRLYVYHRAETEPVVMERFRVMERRLWLAITVPAAWVAVLAGLAMLAVAPCTYLPQGWMTLKLLLVLWLLAMHFLAGGYRREFLEEPFPLTEKAFRVLNEVPTMLMIGIVFLVIYRPLWWWWPICR
ncbi:MAG: CopD family protein [Candidatus Lambdaproteobacteria bacterium]|nr:CopD family protein [Candidatus Lambdaproteobacteria bacterium]